MARAVRSRSHTLAEEPVEQEFGYAKGHALTETNVSKYRISSGSPVDIQMRDRRYIGN